MCQPKWHSCSRHGRNFGNYLIIRFWGTYIQWISVIRALVSKPYRLINKISLVPFYLILIIKEDSITYNINNVLAYYSSFVCWISNKSKEFFAYVVVHIALYLTLTSTASLPPLFHKILGKLIIYEVRICSLGHPIILFSMLLYYWIKTKLIWQE